MSLQNLRPVPIPVFAHTLQHHDWCSGIVEIHIEITHDTTYIIKLTYTCSVPGVDDPTIRVKYITNVPCVPMVVLDAIKMIKISKTPTAVDDCIDAIKSLLASFHDDEKKIKSAIVDELQTELKKTQLQVATQELLLVQAREIERLQAINRQLLEKIEQDELLKSLNGILDASLNELFVS